MGKDKVTLEVEAGGKTETVEAEKVLMAAGRAVNTEDIGLQEAGVQLTERGFVKVDPETLETTAPGVYCIGDVAGPPMLAHKGSREGVVRGRADRRAQARTRSTTATSRASPTAIRRSPASGSPRSRPRRRSSTTRSAGSPSAPTAAPAPPGETEGFVKIIRDTKYGEILGAHIVGPPRVGADPRARRGPGERVHGGGGGPRHPRAPDAVRGDRRGGARLAGPGDPHLR